MGLDISLVAGERDLEAFLNVPATLRPEIHTNKIPGRWVRPLLDRRKNPYFRHTDHALLIARRDGRPAGRVAVFVDHLCNRALREQVGSFGLFDSINSPRTATHILEAAEAWLAEREVYVIRGPLGPAMRLGTGVLIEGHGQAPMPGMTFDPPELGSLIDGAGYDPMLDLHAYKISTDALPAAVVRDADAARRRPGLKLRPFRTDRFEEDIVKIREVINDLPRHGRACTPWTHDEVRWMARKLWPVLDTFLVLILEQRGIPLGVGMALRNVREVFSGRSPRPTLSDNLKIAAALRFRQVRSARIALLAVRPQYDVGKEGDLAALLLAELLGRLRVFGVSWAEISLVDANDVPLLSLLESAGAERIKTYRIYEKLIEKSIQPRSSLIP